MVYILLSNDIVMGYKVYYIMSGFVAFKPMRKYRKSSIDPERQAKCRYIVSVLKQMKAGEQVPCDDTVRRLLLSMV